MRPDILTRSGIYFDFLTPTVNMVRIEDIAHALSRICRFSGHTSEFYSVAQHSVLVSHVVPPQYAFQGLMHDAHEAYVGDCPSPLKQLLPDYRIVEQRAERLVRAAFQLPLHLDPCVKLADLIMLATEQRDLMPRHDDPWDVINGILPQEHKVVPWPSHVAEEAFLTRFKQVAP